MQLETIHPENHEIELIPQNIANIPHSKLDIQAHAQYVLELEETPNKYVDPHEALPGDKVAMYGMECLVIERNERGVLTLQPNNSDRNISWDPRTDSAEELNLAA